MKIVLKNALNGFKTMMNKLFKHLQDAFALICQASPRQSPVGYLMNPSMRGKATAAMNSAILGLFVEAVVSLILLS